MRGVAGHGASNFHTAEMRWEPANAGRGAEAVLLSDHNSRSRPWNTGHVGACDHVRPQLL